MHVNWGGHFIFIFTDLLKATFYFHWGCMRYLSKASGLSTVDGSQYDPSLAKQTGGPAQKLGNALDRDSNLNKCKPKNF